MDEPELFTERSKPKGRTLIGIRKVDLGKNVVYQWEWLEVWKSLLMATLDLFTEISTTVGGTLARVRKGRPEQERVLSIGMAREKKSLLMDELKLFTESSEPCRRVLDGLRRCRNGQKCVQSIGIGRGKAHGSNNLFTEGFKIKGEYELKSEEEDLGRNVFYQWEWLELTLNFTYVKLISLFG